jgi:hypothetical protein
MDEPDKLTDLRLLRSALAPLHERIGELQNTAIQIQALQNAGRAGTASKVLDLRNNVDDVYLAIERAIYALPERARGNSRVDDLRKALERLQVIINDLEVSDGGASDL